MSKAHLDVKATLALLRGNPSLAESGMFMTMKDDVTWFLKNEFGFSGPDMHTSVILLFTVCTSLLLLKMH